MEFVEAGIVIVAGELDLELHLILRDGHPANLTRGTDAWTAPRSIRGTSREFPVFDGRSGFLAKEGVRRASWWTPANGGSRWARTTPDARGSDAGLRHPEGPVVGGFRVPSDLPKGGPVYSGILLPGIDTGFPVTLTAVKLF